MLFASFDYLIPVDMRPEEVTGGKSAPPPPVATTASATANLP
jgi:hypothetical protein